LRTAEKRVGNLMVSPGKVECGGAATPTARLKGKCRGGKLRGGKT